MSKVIIFTDGSSRNNPGPGGWGVIIAQSQISDSKSKSIYVRELGGNEKSTTNNRMELMAAIDGISNIKEANDGLDITIFCDSEYVVKGITNWIHGWKKNNWRTAAKKPVLNKDLWIKLDECIAGKKINWKYVAGHSGNFGNERCDEIATSFADNKDVDLYSGTIENYKHRVDLAKFY